MAVKAIPEGYYSLTPYLVVKGAAEAIEFYAKAFGATEMMRMPGPGGRIMHAELKIGNSVLMLSDENPERGYLSPASRGAQRGAVRWVSITVSVRSSRIGPHVGADDQGSEVRRPASLRPSRKNAWSSSPRLPRSSRSGRRSSRPGPRSGRRPRRVRGEP